MAKKKAARLRGQKRSTRKKVSRRKRAGRPKTGAHKKTHKQSKKPRTKKSARKARQQRRRSRGLAAINTADLRAELERRDEALVQLEGEHEALLNQLAALEHDIAALNGAPGIVRARTRATGMRRSPTVKKTRRARRTGRRPRNQMNLVNALKKTLSRKTMSVADATTAVQRAGYKTSSGNFRVIVNQTLLANPKVFKKVARGQYTAKS